MTDRETSALHFAGILINHIAQRPQMTLFKRFFAWLGITAYPPPLPNGFEPWSTMRGAYFLADHFLDCGLGITPAGSMQAQPSRNPNINITGMNGIAPPEDKRFARIELTLKDRLRSCIALKESAPADSLRYFDGSIDELRILAQACKEIREEHDEAVHTPLRISS